MLVNRALKIWAAVFCFNLAAGSGLAVSAKPITFAVDDPKHRDVVSFTSDAPIELIVGHTNSIQGTVELDDSMDLSKQPLTATFTVDLASIDTGIQLRNEHMRSDKFLNTDKFPKAVFKMQSLSATPTVLKDQVTVKGKAEGEFSLHGKTMKKEVPVTITFLKVCATQGKFEDCDLIQIKSTFPVVLKDYDIQRPEIVFQKLADTVFVTVSATAHRESKKAAAK